MLLNFPLFQTRIGFRILSHSRNVASQSSCRWHAFSSLPTSVLLRRKEERLLHPMTRPAIQFSFLSRFNSLTPPSSTLMHQREFFSGIKKTLRSPTREDDARASSKATVFPNPPNIPAFPQQKTAYGLKWTDEYSWLETPPPRVDEVFALYEKGSAGGVVMETPLQPGGGPSRPVDPRHTDPHRGASGNAQGGKPNSGRTALVAEYLRNEMRHTAEVFTRTGAADMARNLRNEMAARNKAISADTTTDKKPVLDRIGPYAYKVVESSTAEAAAIAAASAATACFRSTEAYLDLDSGLRLLLNEIDFPAYVRYRVDGSTAQSTIQSESTGSVAAGEGPNGGNRGKEAVAKEGDDLTSPEEEKIPGASTAFGSGSEFDPSQAQVVLDASLLRHDLALIHKATGGRVAVAPHVQQIKLCNHQRFVAYTLPVGEMDPEFRSQLAAAHADILGLSSASSSSSGSAAAAASPSTSPALDDASTSQLSAANRDPTLGIPISNGCVCIVRDIETNTVLPGSIFFGVGSVEIISETVRKNGANDIDAPTSAVAVVAALVDFATGFPRAFVRRSIPLVVPGSGSDPVVDSESGNGAVAEEISAAGGESGLTLSNVATRDFFEVYREQRDDLLVQDDSAENFLQVTRTKDWRFVLLNNNSKTSSEVHLLPGCTIRQDPGSNAPLQKAGGGPGLESLHSPRLVCSRQPGVEYFVEHAAGNLFFLTNVPAAQRSSAADGATKKKTTKDPEGDLAVMTAALPEGLWRQGGQALIPATAAGGSRGKEEGESEMELAPPAAWRTLVPVRRDVSITDLDLTSYGLVLHEQNHDGRPGLSFLPFDRPLQPSGLDPGSEEANGGASNRSCCESSSAKGQGVGGDVSSNHVPLSELFGSAMGADGVSIDEKKIAERIRKVRLPSWVTYLEPQSNQDFFAGAFRIAGSGLTRPPAAWDLLLDSAFQPSDPNRSLPSNGELNLDPQAVDLREVTQPPQENPYLESLIKTLAEQAEIVRISAPVGSRSGSEAGSGSEAVGMAVGVEGEEGEDEEAPVPITVLMPRPLAERYHEAKKTKASADDASSVETASLQPGPMLVRMYGAYGLPLELQFDADVLSYINRGWSVAWVHARGGGEGGRPWHAAGRSLNKSKGVRDVLAAVDTLVAEGVAERGRIAGHAISAGGLLLGAAMMARPSLFAAAALRVPYLDLVTTSTNPELPLTAHEYDEWGDPQDPKALAAMTRVCPYWTLGLRNRDAALALMQQAGGNSGSTNPGASPSAGRSGSGSGSGMFRNLFGGMGKGPTWMSEANRARAEVAAMEQFQFPDKIYVSCALNDTRVPFWVPIKWVARMRSLQRRVGSKDDNGTGNGGGVVLRIFSGDHSRESAEEQQQEAAEEAAFLLASIR